MNLTPIGLDFDGSIPLQKKLRSELTEIVDLSPLENDLRLWANRNGTQAVRKLIRSFRIKYPGPWFTFLGSGDFHHLTLVLLEEFPVELRPVNLVLIDHHPDWFRLPPQYHCGNWVSGVLKLDWVESITLIGQAAAHLKGFSSLFAPHWELRSGRIRVFPYGSDYQPVFEQLAGKNIYLSIDKDVLRKEEAVTDWDQGRMSLGELLFILEKLALLGNLVGMDICGEKAPRPLRGFWKRLDARRFTHELSPSPPIKTLGGKLQRGSSVFVERAMRKTLDSRFRGNDSIINEATNLRLLEVIKSVKISPQSRKGE